MEQLIELFHIVQSLITDKQTGIVSLLVITVISITFFWYHSSKRYHEDLKAANERFEKLNEENRKDLLEIIEKYQEGQINVIQAINEIKILLATIGAKL